MKPRISRDRETLLRLRLAQAGVPVLLRRRDERAVRCDIPVSHARCIKGVSGVAVPVRRISPAVA